MAELLFTVASLALCAAARSLAPRPRARGGVGDWETVEGDISSERAGPHGGKEYRIRGTWYPELVVDPATVARFRSDNVGSSSRARPDPPRARRARSPSLRIDDDEEEGLAQARVANKRPKHAQVVLGDDSSDDDVRIVASPRRPPSPERAISRPRLSRACFPLLGYSAGDGAEPTTLEADDVTEYILRAPPPPRGVAAYLVWPQDDEPPKWFAVDELSGLRNQMVAFWGSEAVVPHTLPPAERSAPEAYSPRTMAELQRRRRL